MSIVDEVKGLVKNTPKLEWMIHSCQRGTISIQVPGTESSVIVPCQTKYAVILYWPGRPLLVVFETDGETVGKCVLELY